MKCLLTLVVNYFFKCLFSAFTVIVAITFGTCCDVEGRVFPFPNVHINSFLCIVYMFINANCFCCLFLTVVCCMVIGDHYE